MTAKGRLDVGRFGCDSSDVEQGHLSGRRRGRAKRLEPIFVRRCWESVDDTNLVTHFRPEPTSEHGIEGIGVFERA